MKTTIVILVLAAGAAVAIWAQSPPIKWPEQVERSKWPAFLDGPIEQTATICIDVAPKLPSTDSLASYYSASFSLTFEPATQFRLAADGEQRTISSGRASRLSGGFSFAPGRHTIEITVREPVSYVRLTMMLRTNEDGDLPGSIRPCSGAAPTPPDGKTITAAGPVGIRPQDAAGVRADSPAEAAHAACGLGETWIEEEAGYQSTWTRRGTSNVFDAKYLNGQTTVNRVSISGATVSAQRISSSDGNLCGYQGSIGTGGKTIIGTYRCPPGVYGPRPWKAAINCGPQEGRPAAVQPPPKPPEAAQPSAPPKPSAPLSGQPAADVPAKSTDLIDDGIQWPAYIPPAEWPTLFSGAVDTGVDICLEVSQEAARLLPEGEWELKGHVRPDPKTDLRLGVDGMEVPVSQSVGFAAFSRPSVAGKHLLRVMLGSPASAVTAQLVLTSPDFGDRPDLLKSCGASPVGAPRDSKSTNDAQPKGTAVAAPYGDPTGGNGRQGSTLTSGGIAPLTFSGTSLRTKAVCFETTGPKGISLYGSEAELGDYYLRYRIAIQPAEQYNLRLDGDNFAISAEPRGYVLGAYRIKSGRHLFTITFRNPVDKLLIELRAQGSDKSQQVGLKECSSATTGQLKPGVPPRAVSRMTPSPAAVRNSQNSSPLMEPPDVSVPKGKIPQYADPFAKIGPPSNGPGSGGGVGRGSGGGVEGGAFRIGGDVRAPMPIFKPEPEYSEEARAEKFQGTVMLDIVVDVDGKPSSITIARSLGMGLDEKAIEAVEKWRFRPGLKGGRPVPVRANVEVNFRLL